MKNKKYLKLSKIHYLNDHHHFRYNAIGAVCFEENNDATSKHLYQQNVLLIGTIIHDLILLNTVIRQI